MLLMIQALPKFLQCVDWNSTQEVDEVCHLSVAYSCRNCTTLCLCVCTCMYMCTQHTHHINYTIDLHDYVIGVVTDGTMAADGLARSSGVTDTSFLSSYGEEICHLST